MLEHYELYPHILKLAILEKGQYGETRQQTREQLDNFFERNPDKEWMRKEVKENDF